LTIAARLFGKSSANLRNQWVFQREPRVAAVLGRNRRLNPPLPVDTQGANDTIAFPNGIPRRDLQRRRAIS